jgi:predicted RNA-binding Zn ribbon-like protein
VPRYDLPNAAPKPLRLVQLFVNTASVVEHPVEWLPAPAVFATWLGENDPQATATGQPTQADLDRALELREALRALLRRNNTGDDAADAAIVVNEAAARARLRLALDEAGELRLDVGAAGVDAALGRIVAVAYGAMLDGSWTRLKVCRKCCWAFYDPSKNRSGTWCSMQLCGNRAKTREYRRRKAGAR